MKKASIMLIALMVISVGFLSGCNEQTVTESLSDENANLVENKSPTASCSANPTSGESPLQVSFIGTSIDTDGTIISYHWDFGDDETSTEQNPTHIFQKSGIYTVILTVTDNEGAIDSSEVKIFVESESKKANAQIIGDVSIWSAPEYQEFISVVGLVENTGEVNLDEVKIRIDFYDKNDRLVYTEWEYSDYYFWSDYILLPGETCPFEIQIEDGELPPYDYYNLTVSWEETNEESYTDFSIIGISTYYGDEFYHIIGEVKNIGTKTIDECTVFATVFDENDLPIVTRHDFIRETLEYGEKIPFHCRFSLDMLQTEVGSYSIKVIED